MPITLRGLIVLIASPGDTADERDAVFRAISRWNSSTGRHQGVSIIPWMWERDSVPVLGGRPQELINEQAVDVADVVVAFFDAKLGTPTGKDISGTAEEIERASSAGKPVHVYFSSEPIPREVDVLQLEQLQKFKAELSRSGLLGAYASADDLAHQVLTAIEHDLRVHFSDTDEPGQPYTQSGSEARLVWRHIREREPSGIDKGGRPTFRTTLNHLEVRNMGSATAESITFSVSPVNGSRFSFPNPPTAPFDLQPDSSMSWVLIPMTGIGSPGRTVQIDVSWAEGGRPLSTTRTISLS